MSGCTQHVECQYPTEALCDPVVDVSGLGATCLATRKKTADALLETAIRNGVLYLGNHGVPSQLITSVYEQAEEFFLRETEFKNMYYIADQQDHRGYVPVTERGDYEDEGQVRRYEAYDMGPNLKASPRETGNPLSGPNVWPDQVGFRLILGRYLGEMRRLSRLLCDGFELALGVEPGFFWANMDRPMSQLRMLHYLEGNESPSVDTVAMGAHTDYEVFTILHSATPGLEVLNPASHWVQANPIADTFCCNIGDMLEVWTGGIVSATPHRVRHTGRERFSLAYFAATNYETVVEPVVSTRFAQAQRHYEPIVAGHHLMTQLMRDFPYLRSAATNTAHQTLHANPFESRIRAA